MRYLERQWFEYPKTFNFVHAGQTQAHEADLILQSRTFDISPLGDNIYVLCTSDIDHYRVFILIFPDATNAVNFHSAVLRDVDGSMNCSHNWLPPELLQAINRQL